MNNKDTPAMPQTNRDNLCEMTGTPKQIHMGFTKQEELAARFLAAILSNPHYLDICKSYLHNSEELVEYPELATRAALAHVDYLLKGLEEKE